MNLEPLASRIRPNTLANFVGQKHLVGKHKPIRKAIEEGHLFSIIFWGPPGVGKTTLARIYAKSLKATFPRIFRRFSRKRRYSKACCLGKGAIRTYGFIFRRDS